MDADLVLDGNAVAGLLGEIFVGDITLAVSRCEGCGAVETVGALRAYVHAPGAVLRCVHCESVLVRVVRDGDRCWLDLRGLRWLQLRIPASAPKAPKEPMKGRAAKGKRA